MIGPGPRSSICIPGPCPRAAQAAPHSNVETELPQLLWAHQEPGVLALLQDPGETPDGRGFFVACAIRNLVARGSATAP